MAIDFEFRLDLNEAVLEPADRTCTRVHTNQNVFERTSPLDQPVHDPLQAERQPPAAVLRPDNVEFGLVRSQRDNQLFASAGERKRAP